MKTQIRLIFISFLLLSTLISNAVSQQRPSDYKPFVQLYVYSLIDVYDNPVVNSNNEITNWGTLNSELSGRYVRVSSGSGTVVSKDGLILTNAHVAYPELEPEIQYNEEGKPIRVFDRNPVQYLEVMEPESNNPAAFPTSKYWAEIITGDIEADYALLKISTDITTQQPITRTDFSFIEFANPYDLQFGDNISLLGYPGQTMGSLTYSTGEFSGYDPYGRIMTPAYANPGSSGGAALNENVRLIGALTAGTGQKGREASSMSLVHPLPWSTHTLSYYKVKFGLDIPNLPSEWIENSANKNSMIRDRIFLGGRLISNQSRLAVPGASALIYRTDRSIQQIMDLDQDIASYYEVIAPIQSTYSAGFSAERIAQLLNNLYTIEQINQMIEFQPSGDLLQYLQGQFYYYLTTSESDGFIALRGPKNQQLGLIIIKPDQMLNYTALINTTSGLSQDIGTLLVHQTN